MLASDEPTDRPAEPGPACGRWMPRKRTACARRPGHRGECRSAEALIEKRQRKTARRAGVRVADDPAVRARWNRAHRFVRLGMSEDQFNEMLAAQGYACALCREPFGARRRICADHDHGCCPEQDGRWAKTCGQCIRGLLCVPCNTNLGWYERFGSSIVAYLARQAAGQAARRPRS